MVRVIVSSDGKSSISRYAGVGRQLLPDKPLKEISKNGLRQLFIFGMPGMITNNHGEGHSIQRRCGPGNITW